MSAITERFLLCDGDSSECLESFGTDNRSRTIAKLRSDAKSEGWTTKSGKDYCPECVMIRKHDKS